jgi:hypothetical protein
MRNNDLPYKAGHNFVYAGNDFSSAPPIDEVLYLGI